MIGLFNKAFEIVCACDEDEMSDLSKTSMGTGTSSLHWLQFGIKPRVLVGNKE